MQAACGCAAKCEATAAGDPEEGVADMEHAVGRGGCVLVDEIGKMELFSGRLRAAVKRAVESPNPLLATIPLFRHPFLDELRNLPGSTLIRVTPENRESLPGELASRLNAMGRGR
jgi:nucleoside-triphosphatase